MLQVWAWFLILLASQLPMYMVVDASPSNEIDIRGVPPAERYGKALQLAAELAVGASFILVNDRDVGALRHQLETEYRHQFFWNYLEEGPGIWRTHIGRLQARPK